MRTLQRSCDMASIKKLLKKLPLAINILQKRVSLATVRWTLTEKWEMSLRNLWKIRLSKVVRGFGSMQSISAAPSPGMPQRQPLRRTEGRSGPWVWGWGQTPPPVRRLTSRLDSPLPRGCCDTRLWVSRQAGSAGGSRTWLYFSEPEYYSSASLKEAQLDISCCP